MISTVEEFHGQEAVLRLLGAYLHAGKLAGTLLVMGQRGVGKTTLATVIGRALCCSENQQDARLWFCGECYACKSIASGAQPEFVIVRPRSQDITVSQVEEDHDSFRPALLHPNLLPYRVYIIDDAHHLNDETGNQLLKLFEEAPQRTVFILVTDKPQQLLPTIHSRGQKFILQPMPTASLIPVLITKLRISDNTASEAARMAAGRYVDACELARNDEWRQAIKGLARAIAGRGVCAAAAEAAAEFEFDALWDKVARDLGVSVNELDKLVKRGKTDQEKGLKVRRNTLRREALVTAYNRASWWLLGQGVPPPKLGDELSILSSRISGNVDANLAQAAFELGLS